MTEADRKVAVLCGEAAVDEIAHLEPELAGAALGYAVTWHGVTLECERNDAAVLAFFAGVRKEIDEAEQRLRGRVAKEAAA